MALNMNSKRDINLNVAGNMVATNNSHDHSINHTNNSHDNTYIENHNVYHIHIHDTMDHIGNGKSNNGLVSIDCMIENNKPSYRLGWGGVFNDDDFAEERQGVHNIVKKMVIKAIKLRKEKDSMNIMSVEDKMKGLENRKNEMEELDYLRQMNELRKEQSLN
eukprot:40760_1